MSWKEVSDEMEKIEKIVGSMEEEKKSERRERVQVHQSSTRGKNSYSKRSPSLITLTVRLGLQL